MKQSNKTLLIVFVSVLALVIITLIYARLSLDPTELSKYEQKTQSLDFSNYDRVKIKGAMDVHIARGDEWQSSITHHSPEIFELIDIYIDDNTLHIKEKDNIPSWFYNYKVKINLVMPTLRRVRLAGRSNVKIENFNGEKLAIKASGSSGLIAKNSRYTTLWAKASGSSELHLKKLTVKNAKVELSGSSEVNIRIDGGELEGNLSGSSELNYYGTNLDSKIKATGSSEVNHRR